MKNEVKAKNDIPRSSNDKRIGALKGAQIFAPGYNFDEDNEEIAKMVEQLHK